MSDPVHNADLFRQPLAERIDARHPLAVLASRSPWAQIEAALASPLPADRADGYAHAKQFKRLRKVVKRKRTILGIVLREIGQAIRAPCAQRVRAPRVRIWFSLPWAPSSQGIEPPRKPERFSQPARWRAGQFGAALGECTDDVFVPGRGRRTPPR